MYVRMYMSTCPDCGKNCSFYRKKRNALEMEASVKLPQSYLHKKVAYKYLIHQNNTYIAEHLHDLQCRGLFYRCLELENSSACKLS